MRAARVHVMPLLVQGLQRLEVLVIGGGRKQAVLMLLRRQVVSIFVGLAHDFHALAQVVVFSHKIVELDDELLLLLIRDR